MWRCPAILYGGCAVLYGVLTELDTAGVVFRWRAPDGSEVLAFQQLPDYSNFGFQVLSLALERAAGIAVNSARRAKPPAPHPQSPGVEPRSH